MGLENHRQHTDLVPGVEHIPDMPGRSSSKRPTDISELALIIADEATNNILASKDTTPHETYQRNSAAIALGKLGTTESGPVRAAGLTTKEKQELAKKAAQERWSPRTSCHRSRSEGGAI